MSNGIVRNETYGLIEIKHMEPWCLSPYVVGKGSEFYLAKNAKEFNSLMVRGLLVSANQYKQEDRVLLETAKKLPELEQIFQNTGDLNGFGLREEEINELRKTQGLRVRGLHKGEDENMEIVVGGKNFLLDKPGEMILTVDGQDFQNNNLQGAKIKGIRVGIVKYIEEDRMEKGEKEPVQKKKGLHSIGKSLKERYFGRGRDRE